MIKYSKSLLIPGVFFIIFLASCQSHEPKSDYAFDREKEERLLLKDSNSNSDEMLVEPIKKTEVSLSEWDYFKATMEKKLLVNESKIKQIKGLPNSNVKAYKKVARLEKENNNLRTKMADYHEEMKLKWGKFKTEMTKEMEVLSTELKDMTPIVKK